MNDTEEFQELEMAIKFTEATIRYCQTPEIKDMHIAALIYYKERYDKLKKKLDKIKK